MIGCCVGTIGSPLVLTGNPALDAQAYLDSQAPLSAVVSPFGGRSKSASMVSANALRAMLPDAPSRLFCVLHPGSPGCPITQAGAILGGSPVPPGVDLTPNMQSATAAYVPPVKPNMALYAGGAALLAVGAFFAMKKSK